MNIIVKQPFPSNTIHFNHTIQNANTEVMRINRDGVWVNPDIPVEEAAKAVLDALDSQIKVLVQSTQREWVGLTDEEIDVLVMDSDGLPKSHLEFARAIEAKLREKNT